MGPPSLKAQQLFVGIDPGFAGAIGVLNVRGEFVGVYDLPVRGGEGRSREFDTGAIVGIARRISGQSSRVRVFLEWPTTRPDESAESSKRFGVGLGILEGIWTALGFPPERIVPKKWKGRLGLTGKKENPLEARRQSVEHAREFIKGIPDDTLYGTRGGLKDGRAEALLIAWESLTSTLEGLRNQPEDVRWARVTFGPSKRRRRGGGGLDL